MPHEYSIVKNDKNIFKKHELKPKKTCKLDWKGIKTEKAHKYWDGTSATDL